MDYLKLKEKRSSLQAEIEKILGLAETEDRILTDEEMTSVEEKRSERAKMDKQIKMLDEEIRQAEQFAQAHANDPVSKPTEEGEAKRFDIIEFVGEQRGKEIPMPIESSEKRVAGDGAYVIDSNATGNAQPEATDDVQEGLVEALVPDLILSKLGARMRFNSLDTQVVLADEITGASELLETEEAPEGTGGFIVKTLSPCRIGVVIPMSKRFQNQDTVRATEYILRGARYSMSKKIEALMLSDIAPVSGKNSAGLLHSSNCTASATSGAGIDYDSFASWRLELAKANVPLGMCKFVTTFDVDAILRTKIVAGNTNAQHLLQHPFGQVDGHIYNMNLPVIPSNIMEDAVATTPVKTTALMGNFSYVWFQTFAPMTVLYDPYTLSAKAIDRWVFNLECDWVNLKPETLLKVTAIAGA